ncbi:MAG: hypothetical protein ACRC3Y_11415, partial [Romboutsia sp.]|uniref:hypothetical protein n=1 Tax=Romboutsia sp. TaxID=1965302 RepID=UPI003F2DC8D0
MAKQKRKTVNLKEKTYNNLKILALLTNDTIADLTDRMIAISLEKEIKKVIKENPSNKIIFDALSEKINSDSGNNKDGKKEISITDERVMATYVPSERAKEEMQKVEVEYSEPIIEKRENNEPIVLKNETET